jgi:U3 small nucleolar RNA-associated protein 5
LLLTFGLLFSEKAHEPDAEFNTDEPTMAEKLASFDLAIEEKEKEKEKGERDGRVTTSFVNLPSADSVHVLIRQALHADDQSLLLDCIYTRDEKVN